MERKSYGVLIPIDLAKNIEFLMRVEEISFEEAVIAGLYMWQEKVVTSDDFTEKADKELSKAQNTVKKLKELEKRIKPPSNKN